MAWEGAIENGLLHPLGWLFSLSRVVEGVDNRTEANSEKLLVKAALSGSGTHLLNLTTKPEFGNMLLSPLPFALNLLVRPGFFYGTPVTVLYETKYLLGLCARVFLILCTLVASIVFYVVMIPKS